MQRTVPRPDVVRGCYGLTVTPFRIGVDVERVNGAVVAYFPTLGDTGFRLERLRIFYRKAFKKRADKMVFRDTCYNVWVEALGLCAVAVVE